MNKTLFAISSLAAALAAVAAPQVAEDSVSLSSCANDTAVKITYTLTGEPAVVTIDLQTQQGGAWTSLGGEEIGELGGEANKTVRTVGTPVSAYWFPRKTQEGKNFTAGNLRAVVQAWPTNAPPDYMVVNLAMPTNIVRFYTSTNMLPGGFANLEYKTTKLLMRKIPAKDVVWRMGVETTQITTLYNAGNNAYHKVLLTDDYYIGVYEVTQKQYGYFGTQVSRMSFRDQEDSDILPAQRMQYTSIRGTTTTAPCPYMWPESGHSVKVGCTIDKLRNICGIADMDLPTEAQWEYAAHGGNGGQLYTGKTLAWANIAPIACCVGVNTSHYVVTNGVTIKRSGPYAVGSFIPNDFGLYDVLGNVSEFCLDRDKSNDAAGAADYQSNFQPGWETGAVTTNPVSCVDTSVARASKRGGAWMDDYCLNQVGFRNLAGLEWTGDTGYIGLRLCCSVNAAVR